MADRNFAVCFQRFFKYADRAFLKRLQYGNCRLQLRMDGGARFDRLHRILTVGMLILIAIFVAMFW